MPDIATVQTLRSGLAESRAALLRVISGVTEEQFKRRPPSLDSPDGSQTWSISEVLAHLLASERLQAGRVALALQQDGALVTPSDPAAHQAQARAGRMAPVPQLIHGLLASRREIEVLLDGAASLEDGLERHIVHPRYGKQTVAQLLLEQVIAHEWEHVQQIETLREHVRHSGSRA